MSFCGGQAGFQQFPGRGRLRRLRRRGRRFVAALKVLRQR